jgi:PTS system cellobiose-specific IIC component
LLQVPLQGLGGTLGALVIFMLVAHLLWVFGIHGMMVTLSLMLPIYIPLDNANLVAYGTGQPLPNIIGFAFVIVYILIGGSGATLGLNILMAFRAKSQRYRILGRLALPGGVCGINEPIIFGTPVVLNPILAIPFVLTPIVYAVIAYTATVLNFVPRLPGIGLPLGVPVIVSGFLQGSFRIIALQIALILLGILIYYPFFAMLDKKAYKEETDAASGTRGQSAA